MTLHGGLLSILPTTKHTMLKYYGIFHFSDTDFIYHTVFVPTNEAFEMLPPNVKNYLNTENATQQLQNVLSFHISKGRRLIHDEHRVKTFVTMQDGELIPSEFGLFENNNRWMLYQNKSGVSFDDNLFISTNRC